MKFAAFFAFCLISFASLSFADSPSTPQPAEGIWKGFDVSGRFESELSIYDHNGNTTPSKEEDLKFLDTLRLRIEKVMEKFKYGIEGSVRQTNDRQVDTDPGRLMSLYGFVETDKNLFEAGDVSMSVNPYVFSGSVRGVKHTFTTFSDTDAERKGLELSVIGGIQEATWRELYDNMKNDLPDRWTSAAEARYLFGSAKEMAVSVSGVHDRTSSVAADKNASSAEAVSTGFDVDWRFNRYMTFRGEAGITHTDSDVKSGKDKNTHTAIEAKLLTKPFPKSLNADFVFERVDPGYNAIVGSSGDDKARYESLFTWRLNRQFRTRFGLKYSRDNLEGQLGQTKKVKDGTVDITYRPDFLKRGDFHLRSQLRKTTGRGSNNTQQNNDFGFSVRPFTGFKYGLSVNHTMTDTKSTGIRSYQNAVRNSVSWKKSFKDSSRFRSSLDLDYNFTKADGPDQDSIGYGFSTGYDYKNLLAFTLDYDAKNTHRDASSDSDYSTFMLSAAYYPMEKRNNRILATAERRVYHNDDDSNEYTEDIGKLSYTVTF